MTAAPEAKRPVRIWFIVAVASSVLLALACCAGAYLFLGEVPGDFTLEEDSFSTDDEDWSESDVPQHLRMLTGQPLACEHERLHYFYVAWTEIDGLLRCDMNRETFERSMLSIGLRPWTADSEFIGDPNWLGILRSSPQPRPWWTPPGVVSQESLYVKQQGSMHQIAHHDGNTLWYRIASH